MKIITKVLFYFTAVLTLIGLHNFGYASVVLYDPSWEAPGGYSWANDSGSPIQPGGITWTYSNFNPTAYNELYYVVGDYVDNIDWVFTPAGSSIGSKHYPMTRLSYDSSASNFSEGQVVWNGQINIDT